MFRVCFSRLCWNSLMFWLFFPHVATLIRRSFNWWKILSCLFGLKGGLEVEWFIWCFLRAWLHYGDALYKQPFNKYKQKNIWKCDAFFFYISEMLSSFQLFIHGFFCVLKSNSKDRDACKKPTFTHKINTSSRIVFLYVFMSSTPQTCKATLNNAHSAMLKPLLCLCFYQYQCSIIFLAADWPICATGKPSKAGISVLIASAVQ